MLGAAADPPAARAAKLLQQMQLPEKIQLLHGNNSASANFSDGLSKSFGSGYVGFVPGNARLGIPPIKMNDGPMGFRGPAGTSTQWPSGVTMAQTFDVDLVRSFGEAMGAEFAGKGCDVQFGPGECRADRHMHD